MAQIAFGIYLAAFFCSWTSFSDAVLNGKLILSGDREMLYTNNILNSDSNVEESEIFHLDDLNSCGSCICGIGRQFRIVNGEVTNTKEFPWAVRITHQGYHHCGASLITRRHLITAAHCMSGFNKSTYGLRFAEKIDYNISSVVVHQNYNRYTFDNDIAIIELEQPVSLEGAVRTVCLPDAQGFHYAGSTGVAIGWGRLGEREPLSKELRKVNLPIMSVEECEKSEFPSSRFTDNMFCAGYMEGNRDSCNGDSGGALHVRNDHGAMEVVGLVSFGRGCARPNYPGIYTKVSNYVDWIADKIKGECVCSQPKELSNKRFFMQI